MGHRKDTSSAQPDKGGVRVEASGLVGIIGDDATIENFTVVASRAPRLWPLVVGAPPPVATSFQQRESITRLMRDPEGTVILQQVVSGDGGTGKSQLAAAEFSASTAQVRLWILAESASSVLTGYADAALRLELGDFSDPQEELAARLLGFLAGTDHTWLVVLDDLGDPADMQGLWPTGAGRVIVTTRRRDAALSGGGRKVIDVGAFEPDEARNYMEQRLAPFANRLPENVLEEAELLASDLGYLPLALAQSAAVIIDRAVSCATYRSWFRDRSKSIDELFPPEADADGYLKVVSATWTLAVDAADRLINSGIVRPLAQLGAMFDPNGVPEAVLMSRAARSYLAEQAGIEMVRPDEVRAAVRALDRLSLVAHDPRSSSAAIRMHNLTGRAIVQAVPGMALDRLVECAWQALEETWFDGDRDFADSIRANIQWIHRAYPDAVWGTSAGVPHLLSESADSALDAGQVAAALVTCREIADQAEIRLSADHPDTLAANNHLARAFQEAGRLHQAIALFESNLSATDRTMGTDHPDTLTARNDLAAAYQAAGNLPRAISIFEKNVADRERVLGPDHPATLSANNNLARSYQDAGDLRRAIPLFERTLADHQRVLHQDDPSTLTALNNLATAYYDEGRVDQAIPLLERGLAWRERVLGAGHPDTLVSRNNLAYAHLGIGWQLSAIRILRTTLTDSERILGSDHPQTLSSRNSLAYAFHAAGNLKRAIPLFEKNLAERERLLGSDHPRTLNSRTNLACAYESAGDLASAIPLFEKNLDDSERVLGLDHPHTLECRHALAHGYHTAGDLGRAIPFLERNLADRLRVLGPTHPETVVSRDSLNAVKRR